MNYTVLCVGKIKENYWNEAIREYLKRLSRYGRTEIIEVADEKTDENASEKENEQVKLIEGRRLLEKIPRGARVIALAIEGKSFDSVELSRRIEEISVQGESRIALIIGGSLGLSPEVLAAAQEKWSFSKLTFPHQLMRVILLEQLYRAERIRNHEPYHK